MLNTIHRDTIMQSKITQGMDRPNTRLYKEACASLFRYKQKIASLFSYKRHVYKLKKTGTRKN